MTVHFSGGTISIQAVLPIRSRSHSLKQKILHIRWKWGTLSNGCTEIGAALRK
jgi:hypothetical protein